MISIYNFQRSRLSLIMSFKAFEILAAELNAAQAGIPDKARLAPIQYFKASSSANQLTKIVVWWINHRGGFAERVNTTGIPRKDARGVMRWTRSGSTPGSADIHAVYNGQTYKIEIKVGRDKMSEAQHKYKQNVIAAGGVYLECRRFDDVLNLIP